MGSLSAGADAINGDDGRVHQAQLLMLVHAQLIAAASPALQWGHLCVGLGPRRQEEAHAPCDQHVPDTVDVEVVLLRLHEGVEGHGRCSDHGSRKEEEHPALPGGRVATPPAYSAHRLAQTHRTVFSFSPSRRIHYLSVAQQNVEYLCLMVYVVMLNFIRTFVFQMNSFKRKEQ